MPNPRTPTALKELRGTRRPDREPAAIAEPDPEIPAPPVSLAAAPWGERALAEWHYIAPRLASLGLLSALDGTMLAAYCHAVGRHEYALEQISLHGATQEKGGWVQVRPEVTIMRDALNDIKRFGALFGLSPSDRGGIAVPDKRSESSPFSKLKAV